MRITQRQLRQIINEELGHMQEADDSGQSWAAAKSECATILIKALRAKYAKNLKAGNDRAGSFSAKDLRDVVNEKLNSIEDELESMSGRGDW